VTSLTTGLINLKPSAADLQGNMAGSAWTPGPSLNAWPPAASGQTRPRSSTRRDNSSGSARHGSKEEQPTPQPACPALPARPRGPGGYQKGGTSCSPPHGIVIKRAAMSARGPDGRTMGGSKGRVGGGAGPSSPTLPRRASKPSPLFPPGNLEPVAPRRRGGGVVAGPARCRYLCAGSLASPPARTPASCRTWEFDSNPTGRDLACAARAVPKYAQMGAPRNLRPIAARAAGKKPRWLSPATDRVKIGWRR
jgi:hypothetical protein